MKLGQSDPRNRVKTERTDRAVSPVIGVILMVAITVILAAVIGVFVLGLGDELGDAAPSNSISVSGEYDLNGDSGEIVFSHDNGDSVDTDDVAIVIRDESGATIADDASIDHEWDVDELSVGDGETVVLDGDSWNNGDPPEETVEVQLVHTPSDSIIATGEFDVVDTTS